MIGTLETSYSVHTLLKAVCNKLEGSKSIVSQYIRSDLLE